MQRPAPDVDGATDREALETPLRSEESRLAALDGKDQAPIVDNGLPTFSKWDEVFSAEIRTDAEGIQQSAKIPLRLRRLTRMGEIDCLTPTSWEDVLRECRLAESHTALGQKFVSRARQLSRVINAFKPWLQLLELRLPEQHPWLCAVLKFVVTYEPKMLKSFQGPASEGVSTGDEKPVGSYAAKVISSYTTMKQEMVGLLVDVGNNLRSLRNLEFVHHDQIWVETLRGIILELLAILRLFYSRMVAISPFRNSDGPFHGLPAAVARFDRFVQNTKLLLKDEQTEEPEGKNMMLWHQVRISTIARFPSLLEVWEEDSKRFKKSKYEPITFPFNQGRSLFVQQETRQLHTGEHHDFVDRANIPFTLISGLGSGGSAWVDMVKDTWTGRVYARKVIEDRRTRSLQTIQGKFKNEVEIIRRIGAHRHIINLFASYTFKRELSLILEPAADSGDLATMLQNVSDTNAPVPSATRETLLRAFGCLASGLAFMHREGIRHKDIKPGNILIHAGEIIYTDFGISLDSKLRLGPTTTGRPEALTQRYAAPEVHEWEPRRYFSDVFSLGCTYVEILSVLEPDLIPEDTVDIDYRDRIEALIDVLKAAQPANPDLPFICWTTAMMLPREGKERVFAERLFAVGFDYFDDLSERRDQFFCEPCAAESRKALHDIQLGLSAEAPTEEPSPPGPPAIETLSITEKMVPGDRP